ncbi:TPA: hypothetical protein N0F65_002301 [Lagenidium giganteum]|uniref:PX domain-containing protein n=1 Tax=Lagenidium giganteum TaxID=4803 RepID=A0AAV2Z1F8_9STRA|nr:TPA: hypothetical protein N0F65_002301 [Lagenidium giganteum]
MDVIFEHRITSIPTNRGKALSRQYHGKADRVVLRPYSEFAALRKPLWKIAQRDHGIVRCRYCEEFFNYVLFSKTQPNTTAKLTTSKEKRMRMLEAFVNDVIAMAWSCETSQSCRTISGKRLFHTW